MAPSQESGGGPFGGPLTGLLVSQDSSCIALARQIPPDAVRWDVAATIDEALLLEDSTPWDAIVVDTDQADAVHGMASLAARSPASALVACGSDGSFDVAVNVVRHGAHDYLTKDRFDSLRLHRVLLAAVDGSRRHAVVEARARVIDRAFDALTVGIAILDASGTVVSCNRAWQEAAAAGDPALGIGPTLGERSATDAGAAREEVLQGVRLVLDGTLSELRTEYQLECDGADSWIALTIIAMPGGAVVARRDVTAEKAVARARQQSEAEFRVLVERFPEGMAIHREGHLTWLNPALLQSLGAPDPARWLGKPVSSLLHPEDAPATLRALEALRETGTATPWQESRLIRADGSAAPAEVQSVPVHFEGEAAVLTIWRDLTQKREFMARMLQAERIQSVGLLTASLGHEINNPMSLVAANIDVALHTAKSLCAALEKAAQRFEPGVYELASDTRGSMREICEALTDARKGALRVRAVVQDLKSFSRPESLEDGPVRLESVIEAALNMTWNEIRHRARLVKDFAAVPNVLGNEARLGQVFLNLLTNAAHAIEEGAADRNEISVRVYAVDSHVVTEISDTGTGIASENLSRVFEPFFTTKPPSQGTGLGLPISREIVGALGGDIEIRSAPGGGTTVAVRLRATDAQPRPLSTLAPVTPPRRSFRVLVVDDEPLIGRLVGRCLGKGPHVDVVEGGRQALEQIRRSEPYDVILLDVMMPEMSGIEVYETLRAEAPERLNRVVFLTGGAFTPLARQFLEQVPNPQIAKPFDAATLREAVDRAASQAG